MSQLHIARSPSSCGAWLSLVAPEALQVGAHCWQLSQEDCLPLRMTAPVDANFVLFDAPAPVACKLEQAPQWLFWNTWLAGHAKIALVSRPWRLRLRAEIPVHDDANAAVRVAETLVGMRAASRLLGDIPASDSDLPLPVSNGDVTGTAPSTLPALLRETGWPFHERNDGLAVVELAMRGGGCRVLLQETAFGVRAGLELLRADALTPRSRLALAALLLSAGGALRLARPYAVDGTGPFTCGFEVRFTGETTAGELEHALEALAVACWACKEEVHSLLDNSVAESYLAIRNLPPLLAREEF